jgi:Tfp pilus assembly protein PilF
VAVVVLAGAGWFVYGRIAVERDAADARLAVAAGRFEKAVEPLTRWLDAQPSSAEAHYLKARLALARKDGKEAAAELAVAQSLGYPQIEIDRIDGLVKAGNNRSEEAEPLLAGVFNQASAPDPEVDEALTRIYLQSYKLQQAARVLARWMRDAPRDPKPYLWHTELDVRLHRPDAESEAHYRGALERDPRLGKARLGLADVLYKMKRYKEAAQEYARYLADNPNDVQGYVAAARNALDLGDDAQAVAYLDRGLAIAPDDGDALTERAGIDQRHGDYTTALARLNRALATTPELPIALYRRSLVLDRMARRKDANADRRKLAQVNREREELNKLIDKLKRDSHNLELRLEIAQWMFAHGRDDEGKRWAELILSSRRDFEPANRLLANYYQARGDDGLANYYRMQLPGGAKPGRAD